MQFVQNHRRGAKTAAFNRLPRSGQRFIEGAAFLVSQVVAFLVENEVDGVDRASAYTRCAGSYTTSMPSASNRRLAVEEFVKRLRQGLSSNMLDVRLFGSEARGEATSESDIDVLVVVQPDTDRVQFEDRIIDIAFDVNLDFGVYISPRVVTPRDPERSGVAGNAVHQERRSREHSIVNPSDALAQHRMARAHVALQEADLLIEQQHFSGALNRVYYAAFYEARAMLATRSLDSSRHSASSPCSRSTSFARGSCDRDGTRITPCL